MIANQAPPHQSRDRGPPLPQPSPELIQRAWARSPHAEIILKWATRLSELDITDRALFAVALRLEEGDLPWIAQHGFAFFEPEDSADHRLITQAEEGVDDDVEGHERPATRQAEGTTSRSTERSTRRRSAAEAQEAEARASVRWDGGSARAYANVGEVMDEDRWELGVMFPGFSPPIYDRDLDMFFREGRLQPLAWFPATFVVRVYYEDSPKQLPIVRISPEPPPDTPHMFQMVRNRRSFRSVCYTFAPDGTVARGRGWDDTVAEVLRQVVVWLLRYLVWCRLRFFPGVQVGHSPAELLASLPSDAPCPYHADRPYGECCRPKHEAQVKRARPAQRSSMVSR